MENFTKYEQIQIDEVCRICLQKKEQMSLICEAGFADMLLECASIQVTPENGLFNLVCRQCANEVSRWYVFKQQIIRSFEIGKWLLEKKPKNLDSIEIETIKDNECNHQNVSSSINDVNELQIVLGNDVETLQDKSNESYQSSIILDESSSQNIDSTILNVDTSQEIKVNKIKKSPQQLTCKVCDKQCKSSNSYNRHIRTHDDSRPFVCSKCDKPFKTSQVLTEHMKRHYDDRRHKCEVCGMKYYAKASLNDHMRSHTGERPFKCGACGKTFATRAILRQHMAVFFFCKLIT